jgi:MFS family permease
MGGLNSKFDTAAESAVPRLMTREFMLLCAATALGYAHHALLTPILPLFIKKQGGTASLVGLVTAAFSVTSFVFRPFIGRAVDNWSSKGMMLLGTLVLGLCSLGYLVYDAVLLFIFRAIHGIGWAAYNTVSKVLVSATAPTERRGEAAGYYSMSQSVATALVPAIALWILSLANFSGVFVISAAAGFLATVAALAMTIKQEEQASRSKERFWDSLIERSVLMPSILEFLTKITQPASAIFIPLYAVNRGIAVDSLPYYYLAYGLVGIGARGVLGRLSDRIGRYWTITCGTTMSVAALVLTSQASDIVFLALGGLLFGLATAAFAPSVMALAIDRAPRDRLGSAMATYSMAFQLAQGAGGLLGGLLIDTLGYQAMYLIMTLPPLAAQLIVVRNGNTLNKVQVSF